jgi:hypothetical protein
MIGILTQRSTQVGTVLATAQSMCDQHDTGFHPRPNNAKVLAGEAYFTRLRNLALKPDERVPTLFFIGCANIPPGVDSDRKNEKLCM